MRIGRTLGVGAVIALGLAACAGGGASPGASSVGSAVPSMGQGAAPSAARADLTIFAAASLARVLDEIEVAYETAVPGATITVSTDSSAALATQISEGAPADVFLSADTTNPQRLVDAGLTIGGPRVFAANELTVIIPTDNPGDLTSPVDLGKPGLRVIAAAADVPITRYATRLVENLAMRPGAPTDFAAAYAANVVSKEDNVAAVRTKIELGEGDAAIVYVTDAAASEQVATIEVEDDVNVAATYAGVVLAASTNADAAHAVLEWLIGPDGQAVLGRFGFLSPAS